MLSRRGFFGAAAAAVAAATQPAAKVAAVSSPPMFSGDIERLVREEYGRRFREYIDIQLVNGDGTPMPLRWIAAKP